MKRRSLLQGAAALPFVGALSSFGASARRSAAAAAAGISSRCSPCSAPATAIPTAQPAAMRAIKRKYDGDGLVVVHHGVGSEIGARMGSHASGRPLRHVARGRLAVPLTLMAAVVAAAAAGVLAAAATPVAAPASEPFKKPLTTAEILASSVPSDWRPLDPQQTLYLELSTGRVVIELMPQFAPRNVANVEALARGGYYDGLAIFRVQDNYVVEWGDAEGRKPVGTAQRTVGAEFERPLRGVSITRLPDPDTYAPEVGFVDGFPVAADPVLGRAWLVHCYGMVGAGRDNDVDSGGGTELYVVTGQAPRHLDRNVTLLGRVVSGMERLSDLPRGTGPLGRYEHPEQRIPVKSVRLEAEVPAAQRTELEVLRTDTPAFLAYIEARRSRHEEWFKVPAGHVDVCNVPIPARPKAGSTH